MDVENDRACLPGGLETLISTNPSARTLTVSLFSRRGAQDDPPGRAGLAHLVEHLWAGGEIDDRPAAQLIEELGGRLEGVTYPQYLRLEAQVPLTDAETAVVTLGTLLRRGPGLGKLATEKRALLAECREAGQDPGQRVNSLLWDGLGRDFLYHGFRPDLFAGLESLSGADVERWVSLLGTDQWVLHVQSPLSSGEVLPLLERAFARPFRAGLARAPRPLEIGRRTSVRVERTPEGSYLGLGALFAQTSPSPEDYAAAHVLANLLVGGNRGRLGAILRHERGLVYDIVGAYSADREVGGLELYTYVEEGRDGEVLEVLLDELQSVARGDFSPGELSRARAYAAGSYLVEMENPARLARWVSNRFLAMGWTMTPVEWYNRLDRVEAHDVRRQATSLFEDSPTVWAVSAPEGAALSPALTRLGPPEEVSPRRNDVDEPGR